MSRKSEYEDADILRIIHEEKYTRESGHHVNGASLHVLKHSCGMINEKSSKVLLSKKRRCRFLPCHPRGALSLLYVRSIARKQGVEEVEHPAQETVPLECLVISADDKLVWRKGAQTMTQSWNEVRKRALSVKNGIFFQADGTRRKARSGVLTLEALESICAARQLRAPASPPARRHHKAEYIHMPCSKPVSLRFSQLVEWSEQRCETCFPRVDAATEEFRSFLHAAGMSFNGTLALQKRRKQVDRLQYLEIECLSCKQKNEKRIYDAIRYRGFVYCDNPQCSNTYPAEDQPGKDDDYYVELLRGKGIKTFADAQQLYPRAMGYLGRGGSQSARLDDEAKQSRYARVRDRLGLDANALTKDFTDDELRSIFIASIESGIRNIGQLRSHLPASVNNYINRRVRAGDMVHHRILSELDFRFKRAYWIETLEDAIDCVKSTKCESWSAFVTRFPEASTKVIDLGFKADVMVEFGWSPLVNYSSDSNTDLLARAAGIFRSNNLRAMSDLDTQYCSLIVNIRSRGLMDALYEELGLQKPYTWRGMSFDELLAFVRANSYASSSIWHDESSGSYKYAASQNWVRDVAREIGWGEYRGLNGYRYDSIPETIVSNVMHLADVDFADHPRIDQFDGFGGGRPSADFLVGNCLWVEVWAYRADETPTGKFSSYPAIRRHKEAGYAARGMRLCSIEGGLFYRKQLINGTSRAAGLSNFLRHVCECLTAHGCPVDFSTVLERKIRESLAGQENPAGLDPADPSVTQ